MSALVRNYKGTAHTLSRYVLEHSSSFVNEMHGSLCDGCAGCDTVMEPVSDAEIADIMTEAPPGHPVQVLLVRQSGC